jgi:hypothetical protein
LKKYLFFSKISISFPPFLFAPFRPFDFLDNVVFVVVVVSRRVAVDLTPKS